MTDEFNAGFTHIPSVFLWGSVAFFTVRLAAGFEARGPFMLNADARHVV